MQPLVSVVLPVRNGERWLAEALDSVTGQALRDWELIAIDDGSQDGTPGILADCAARDSRVSVVRQEALGLVAALNRGVAAAQGSYIARLDADDRAVPDRLDRQAAYLESHPEVGLLGTWAQEIDGAGRRRGVLRPPADHADLERLLMRGNPFVHSSVMLRTALVRRLGGFRATFQAAEDYDLWLRIAETATVANLPQVLVEYRVHGGNVTARNAVRQAFSARLARLAARLRRETGRDPAQDLAAAPDWRAAEASSSFYAEDAALYRLLDLADPDVAAGAGRDADFGLLASRFDDLTHAERALAARAMLYHVRSGDRAAARRTRTVFLHLLRRKPGMMQRGLWRLLPAALLR
jgi:glycosyltransferase involved in cell wall biosynthesis